MPTLLENNGLFVRIYSIKVNDTHLYFGSIMASLQDDFWPAIFHDDTDYAHSITSCFLELEKMNQDFESKLHNDFHDILNSMGKLSISPTPRPSPNLPTRTTSFIHNSAFTLAAYSWLLENVANPYPSSAVKASLAQQYACSLSAVNSWFVNARRRMGWTVLCRDYFNNCRADALDAAHRALVNEDSPRPLSPDIIHAFVRVKVAAESLYSSVFTKSTLAGDLDAVVRDISDQDLTPIGGRKHRQPEDVEEPAEASEVELQHKAPYCCSSSDYSGSSSPVPPLDESLTDDSEEEEVSPPTLIGRKRRLSCSESATLRTKRQRNMCPSRSPSVETCLSSSAKSWEHDQKSRSRSIPQPPTSILASRKRCLSDTDATGIPERPQALIAGPPFHAVSDLLPSSTLESDHIIDEWFNANFDDLFSFPPPVDVIEPSLSVQWEVELFNNYDIPQESQPRIRPFQSLNPVTEDQASVDLSALDDLLQSLENRGFVVPTEVTDSAVAVSDADMVPQDLSLSSESIDWIALLNAQTCEPAFDHIFGEFHTNPLPLPEIDLSILQLP